MIFKGVRFITQQISIQHEQNERLIEAVENLSFSISCLKNYRPKDYTDRLMEIFLSLKTLDKIQYELHLLNKTIIMSALLLSAAKNPEKTLNEYNKIINQYLK